mmetsp:Transcript_13723/g.33787  ORF Transcript_13723/g.33787 Transcript_13723/m.33787 type:complete len:275 (-) Transcript_13723:83-907(-)|eukprot:CAMPEP_0178982042 /NCGR_PEP_ID=MMETSP0795-20121207/281_1 /TAXON_ID=88552 /ORGANISM="Amoebophrya sp., Strain Ameob2" /LENGTH=274 /DNA_ID=CAMNT_0020672653 /DNA_START=29 /DNA_END=853 /DNA_ORIENTATION=+
MAAHSDFVVSDRVLRNMRSILDGENLLPGMTSEDEMRCSEDGRLFTWSQFERFYGENKVQAWNDAEKRTIAHREKMNLQLEALKGENEGLPKRQSEVQSPRRDIRSLKEKCLTYFWHMITLNDVDGVTALLDSDIFRERTSSHITPAWQVDLPGEDLRWTTLLLATNADGWMALHLAAQHAAGETAAVLCDRFPWLIDARPMNAKVLGATPLHLAAENDHRDVARILLKKKARLHALNEIGETPIEKAKQQGHLRMEQLLIGFALARAHGKDDT